MKAMGRAVQNCSLCQHKSVVCGHSKLFVLVCIVGMGEARVDH